jgi:hypothetical protein
MSHGTQKDEGTDVFRSNLLTMGLPLRGAIVINEDRSRLITGLRGR